MASALLRESVLTWARRPGPGRPTFTTASQLQTLVHSSDSCTHVSGVQGRHAVCINLPHFHAFAGIQVLRTCFYAHFVGRRLRPTGVRCVGTRHCSCAGGGTVDGWGDLTLTVPSWHSGGGRDALPKGLRTAGRGAPGFSPAPHCGGERHGSSSLAQLVSLRRCLPAA